MSVTQFKNCLEMRADYYLCLGKPKQFAARLIYLGLNLSDGYGIRKSLSEFIHPPYGV